LLLATAPHSKAPGAPPRPDIAGAASVALFCERAAAVSSRFEPDAATLDAIGEICRRLEGLPLAIELVAAYARQHSSQDLLARLDDRMAPGAFERVDGDAGGEVARHRDLTTAIRFSYDLLDDTPRRLLRRLSVFDGGWSVDALDAVCGDGDRPGVLLDALSELTDLHLAEPATAVHGRTRSRLLESVRTFAAEELAWSGEAAVIAARHAEFFVDLAVEAALGLESRRARQWSEEIDEELANLRAAMDHLASTGRSVDALRAAAGLGRYWLVRGPATEGLRRLDQYLHRSGPSGETANGEAWAGRLAFELFDAGAPGLGGDDPVARIDRARDALSASGDEWAYLRATVHLSYSLRVRGELVPAEEVADDGLERCTTPETLWWEAELLNQRSLAVRGRDHERAVLLADRAIEAARASGHERGLTDATFTRLLLDMDRGLATASAVEHLYDRCGEIGNTRVQSIVAMCAGALAARDGDPSAATWYLRAIDIGRETGYDRATWWAMSGVVIALASARPSDAAGLHGSLHARADELLPLTSPGHRAAYERAVSTLRHSLEPVEFARLVRAGEQLPWDEAVDAARQLASDVAAESEPVPVTTDPARRRHRSRGPRANPELTERELEILAELVRGHTNQHIADDLGISPKTVMHHTTSVYRKLTVRGRAEAVAHALRSGLVTT
jgi:DNA-binding CsgD family transcriptional regulator